MTSGPLQIGSR